MGGGGGSEWREWEIERERKGCEMCVCVYMCTCMDERERGKRAIYSALGLPCIIEGFGI